MSPGKSAQSNRISWRTCLLRDAPGRRGKRRGQDSKVIDITFKFSGTNTYWQRVPRGKTFTSLLLRSPPLLVRQVHRGITQKRKDRSNYVGGEWEGTQPGFQPSCERCANSDGFAAVQSRLYGSNWILRAHGRRGWNRCKVAVI